MLGFRAVLYNLLPLIPLAVFALVIVHVVRSKEQRWRHGAFFALLLLFVLLSFFFLTGTALELRQFYFLRTLQAQDAASITVADKTITDETAIKAIVPAFHNIFWFKNNHGGWATEVRLRIHLTTGADRTFIVALYRPQRGAVIRAQFGESSVRTQYDCGFSPDLPDVLSRLNVPLPAQ